MASSEIEIVSESADQKPSNQNPNELQITDIYSASAYGDFEKLRHFVENDGVSVSQPDGNGYYPLQWAALNNFTDAVQYIIERGGDVNASDNAGQTALHWAAVRGSIAAADTLLQNGARVEAADVNGYRLHKDCFLTELNMVPLTIANAIFCVEKITSSLLLTLS
ncbi:putative protein S-acyltransferase 23 [Forsythia ovata]|uniref:protein S-acyltransferase n=1 Tax=Forsythia ovata TaxID=205694 RepID=A0ABD1VLE2_9LAMI